jgi:hypothetical protein
MRTLVIETRSGSLYELDTEQKRVRRVLGQGAPKPRIGEDGQWKTYADIVGPYLGERLLIFWDAKDTPLFEGSDPEAASPTTITSAVVDIREMN